MSLTNKCLSEKPSTTNIAMWHKSKLEIHLFTTSFKIWTRFFVIVSFFVRNCIKLICFNKQLLSWIRLETLLVFYEENFFFFFSLTNTVSLSKHFYPSLSLSLSLSHTHTHTHTLCMPFSLFSFSVYFTNIVTLYSCFFLFFFSHFLSSFLISLWLTVYLSLSLITHTLCLSPFFLFLLLSLILSLSSFLSFFSFSLFFLNLSLTHCLPLSLSFSCNFAINHFLRCNVRRQRLIAGYHRWSGHFQSESELVGIKWARISIIF